MLSLAFFLGFGLSAISPLQVASAFCVTGSSSPFRCRASKITSITVRMGNTNKDPAYEESEIVPNEFWPNFLDGPQEGATINRREMFSDVISRSSIMIGGAVGCGCCFHPNAAYGLAQITTPASENLELYDLPRNVLQDAAFAQGMAVGMMDYEREAYPTKKRLFRTLFDSLEKIPDPVIVEVGIGSFPNALYYKQRLTNSGGVDIIGVDPNDRMEGYAKENAAKVGLNNNNNNSLRIVHGVSEALPLEDGTADAVVCTLTLCSVVDPAKSVAEIRRVLKPGGKFLFWEHVLSETDSSLATYQIQMTPNQVKRADGCHLDRRTGEVIRAAGFRSLDLEYMELKNFSFLNPTVCGIATA